MQHSPTHPVQLPSVMNLLKLLAVVYFCSIIVKSINNVCFDRPHTIGNLQKARLSKCKLAEHSFLYLGFFDFDAHVDIVRGFDDWSMGEATNASYFGLIAMDIR